MNQTYLVFCCLYNAERVLTLLPLFCFILFSFVRFFSFLSFFFSWPTEWNSVTTERRRRGVAVYRNPTRRCHSGDESITPPRRSNECRPVAITTYNDHRIRRYRKLVSVPPRSLPARTRESVYAVYVCARCLVWKTNDQVKWRGNQRPTSTAIRRSATPASRVRDGRKNSTGNFTTIPLQSDGRHVQKELQFIWRCPSKESRLDSFHAYTHQCVEEEWCSPSADAFDGRRKSWDRTHRWKDDDRPENGRQSEQSLSPRQDQDLHGFSLFCSESHEKSYSESCHRSFDQWFPRPDSSFYCLSASPRKRFLVRSR